MLGIAISIHYTSDAVARADCLHWCLEVALRRCSNFGFERWGPDRGVNGVKGVEQRLSISPDDVWENGTDLHPELPEVQKEQANPIIVLGVMKEDEFDYVLSVRNRLPD